MKADAEPRKAAKARASHPSTSRTAPNVSPAVKRGLKRGGVAGIGREKLALVHVARRALQMDEDVYRATLYEVAGVDSAANLSEVGFRAVMARMDQLGFSATRPASRRSEHPGDRPGMATGAQVSYIRWLWARWLGRSDEAALIRWIEDRYRVSAIRFLDVVAAQKAIEGLKQMIGRQIHDAVRESEVR